MPESTKRPSPALASRVVIAGAAVGAGLTLVGAMAAASASEAPSPAVRRVVVVDTTPDAGPYATADVPPMPSAEIIVVPAPTSEPAVVDSGGS